MTRLIKTKNYHDCDQYLITKGDQTNSIVWQTGTEAKKGINGLQIVDVIILAIERLLELDPELSDCHNAETLIGLITALGSQALRDGKEEELEEVLTQTEFLDVPNQDAQHEIIKELYDYELGDTVK